MAGAAGSPLGFGIINAGRAVDAARRVDRSAPESRLRARRSARLRGKRRVRVRMRWRGKDLAGRAGLVASGVGSYDVYLKSGGGRTGASGAARAAAPPWSGSGAAATASTRGRATAGQRRADARGEADARIVVRR